MKNTLADSESWLTPWDGKVVVYRLHWSGKGYIGSSSNVKSRMAWWRSNLQYEGVDLDQVEVEILGTVAPEARELTEKAYIAAYNTFALGHNQTHTGRAGAKMGHPVSVETVVKIKEAKAANPWRPTEEQLAKMRAAKLGKIPWNKGKRKVENG